ncbi:Deacetoxyvindoline 4-hydroxylase [Linum grandiflorum]
MAASPASFFSPNDAGSVAAANEAARQFDETKAGIKGLVDAGVIKVPALFRLSPKTASLYDTKSYQNDTVVSPAVIDLQDLAARRAEVVEEIRRASAGMGVFQVVNHGVDRSAMDEMLSKAREFHEQPKELKAKYYSRDVMKKVRMFSGDTILKISDHIRELGTTLSELFSEALGLQPDHLKKTNSVNFQRIGLNYYPPCPEPEFATGQRPHFDPFTFTVLLQDQTGGLQVFHDGAGWINVPPLPGAFTVNVGNFMQLISNGRLKSGEHKVVANRTGSRVSAGFFFEPVIDFSNASKRMYGPIEELVSEKCPKLYREISLAELLETVFPDCEASDHERNSGMARFKI